MFNFTLEGKLSKLMRERGKNNYKECGGLLIQKLPL